MWTLQAFSEVVVLIPMADGIEPTTAYRRMSPGGFTLSAYDGFSQAERA